MSRFAPNPGKRTPKPWYWEKRKGWYVQLDGKQIELGSAEIKTRKPPEEVTREFHRLMAVGGLIAEKDREDATVPEAVEVFLDSQSNLRPKSVKAYRHYLCFAQGGSTPFNRGGPYEP